MSVLKKEMEVSMVAVIHTFTSVRYTNARSIPNLNDNADVVRRRLITL